MGHYDDLFEAERAFRQKRRENLAFQLRGYDIIERPSDRVLEVYSPEPSFPYEPLMELHLPKDDRIVAEAIRAYDLGKNQQGKQDKGVLQRALQKIEENRRAYDD